jgi:hypothetical protein
MDLTTLRANHPELYRQAFDAGVAAERGRVVAHLDLGRASGISADRAIRSGASVIAWMPEYRAAASCSNQNSRDFMRVSERIADGLVGDRPQGQGASSATPDERQPDLGDRIVAEMERMRGGAL